MIRILLFIGGIFIAANPTFAQQQGTVEFFNDYGDRTVQTFVGESSQLISGVELSLLASGDGADVTVRIFDLLDNGSLGADVLATGVFSRDGLPQGEGAFRPILFDTPFALQLDEDYGLSIAQFGSGPTGFTNYGAASGDSYANGFLGSTFFDPIDSIAPDSDLAFRFIAVPEPSTPAAVVVLLSLFTARRRKRNSVC